MSMSLQTTVPAFRNYSFLPAFESLKFLTSLLMCVSTDNRKLMQIDNSKQNVGCYCKWGEAVFIKQCYVSFVYFGDMFQLGQMEVLCFSWDKWRWKWQFQVVLEENAGFCFQAFAFDHIWL